MVKLSDTLLKVSKIKWHVVAHIPFKIIPVTPFYAVLP